MQIEGGYKVKLTALFAILLTSCAAQTPIQIPAKPPTPTAPVIRQVSDTYTAPSGGQAFQYTLKRVPLVGTAITVYRNLDVVLVKNVEPSASPEVLQISGDLAQGDVLTFVYSTQQ